MTTAPQSAATEPKLTWEERDKQPIDPSKYALDAQELAFFKSATGIEDEAELKEHILAVQAAAYAVFPYGCIRNFNFAVLKISRLPAYPQVLQLAKDRPDAILLDIGCCFGNDIRKAIYDGWPAGNVIGSDIRPEFWELGHKLFRDKQTFSVPFIPGDVFDPSFLSPTAAPPSHAPPPLGSLTSLNPLKSRLSVIHASAFFHLFDEQHQTQLAHLLASLLSPLPGSIIFGSHAGSPTGGAKVGRGGFGHSPESWKALWEGVLGPCEVRADLETRKSGDGLNLRWSVTRL